MMKVFHLEGATDAERFSVMMAFSNAAMVSAATVLWQAGRYVHVADVDCSSLGMAYELTNNIDREWLANDMVRASARVLELEGARSTSMGDVIVDGAGRLRVVCSVGFAALPDCVLPEAVA